MHNILLIALLLLSFVGKAQDTLYFDFFIYMTGSDEAFNQPATIILDEKEEVVIVRTPHEFFSRYVVGSGLSWNTGDEIWYFAGCDRIRFCRIGQEIDGVFVTHRGEVTYFGKDPSAADRYGWTNKSK